MEFLLVQDANEDLNPLQVCLHATSIAHQVTLELIATGQLDLNTIGLSDPRLVPELPVGYGRPLRDLPPFAIMVLQVIQPQDTHVSE